MAAATQDRNTIRKYFERYVGEDMALPASTTIFNGTINARNATGEVRPAADVAGLVVIGVSGAKHVNAVAGVAKVVPPYKAQCGVFKFGTTGVNAITAADIGNNCFVLDDQTVVRAAGTTNSVIAGKVEAMDPDGGVWVAVNI